MEPDGHANEPEPVGPGDAAGAPSQEDGAASGGANDDRMAEAARYLERLLNEGHERWAGDRCPICFLYIGLPMSEHSNMPAA